MSSSRILQRIGGAVLLCIYTVRKCEDKVYVLSQLFLISTCCMQQYLSVSNTASLLISLICVERVSIFKNVVREIKYFKTSFYNLLTVVKSLGLSQENTQSRGKWTNENEGDNWLTHVQPELEKKWPLKQHARMRARAHMCMCNLVTVVITDDVVDTE